MGHFPLDPRGLTTVAEAHDARQAGLAPAGSMLGISAEALVPLRADVLRFAELQLRDRAIGEDLVQESIEAALRKSSSFQGQSTLKTWVFAILRNRIFDFPRQASRTVNLSALVDDDEDGHEKLGAPFTERGAWREGPRPVAWPDLHGHRLGAKLGRVMPNCKEVTQVCSEELEQPLSLGERAALRVDLMACVGCTHYRKQLQTLRQAMQAYAAGKAYPGGARPDSRRLRW